MANDRVTRRHNRVTHHHTRVTLSLSKGLRWAWRWGPAVACMGVLFWASQLATRPPTPGLQGFAWDDKFQHTLAYAILAALAWRALGAGGSAWRRAATAILIAAAYGAFDECHQLFVPTRECSFLDWSADSSGAALAVVTLSVVAALRSRLGGGVRGKEEKRVGREDLRSQG